jgi:putative sigma-54 modulation protein
MKVTYKGVRKELPAKVQEKLDVKFAKLSKLLEQRGEKQAHVVLTEERRLNQAEITLRFYDHQLVGIGRDVDLFTAMSAAIEKLEKQAVKERSKWRETHRRSANGLKPGAAAPVEKEESAPKPRIFRVNHHEKRKPMTVEEALLEMENGQPYMVFRDDKECLSVLVRRKDGHFDLIES